MAAAPCFEDQAREKLKLPREVFEAFTDRMLEHLKKGKSYPETLDAMHEETGLQKETINSIFKRDPKTFSISKQAIARAGHVRMLRDAADAFAGELKANGRIPQEPGKIAKAWDLQRRIALGGHSISFPWTHERNWAAQIPTREGRARMRIFWNKALDPFRYAGEAGKARYEMDMSNMQRGDRYDFWRQKSADITPGKRSPGDILLQNRKQGFQTRNFDLLKLGRYEALENVWKNLDPSIKGEPELADAFAAQVARDMNYSTGSIMPPVGAARNPLARTGAELSNMAGRYNLLMASKLFFAKHMDAYLSPLRYVAKTGRMTQAERAAANVALGRWANTVAAHFTILGVNYAFNELMGWKTPNLTDPSKSDFWRLRLGDWIVPFSPMLEALRLPIVFTSAMAGMGKSTGADTAGLALWRALWNAAHPALHTVYEQASGKDFQGRPVPSIHGLIQSRGTSPYIQSKKEKVSAGEYLGTRYTPIAVSGAIKEFYQALRDGGMEAGMATAFIKSAGAGLSSALLGIHGYEEEPKPPKSTGRTSKKTDFTYVQ